ncbi:hypothetical protein K227x_15320 [Rubripirellula lacrimiformis]|uniref:SxtJ n=1 Tax=Rubripirellula lacrimiformis TaxID=1930273 RepID=A0A517N7R8_9BACT|nr:hypothetical protein [Rubripirellula lacrimiformis]QDT03150.1 hypothetical protein K227x_15320 [Rubripirellula lacrimiformis]
MPANLIQHKDLTDRGLRYFGLSLVTMIFALSWLMHWRWNQTTVAVGGVVVGVLLAVVFFAFPASRRGIHRQFIRLTSPIQWGMTVLILGGFFFLVFFPLGLVLRMLGKSVRQKNSNATTYWSSRQDPTDLKRYFDTY